MKGFTLPLPALARVLPFALYIALIAINPWLTTLFPQFDARWFYALKVSAVALALVLLRHHYTELDRSRWALWGGAVQPLLAALVGGAVFLLWIQLDHPWVTVGQVVAFDPRAADGSIDWPLSMLRLSGMAVVVPVMEELFWRSWLMRAIDHAAFWRHPPQAVSLRALLLSSLVFGLEHRLWFAGVVAGLAYGSLYRRSGNLWTPLIAHAVTNMLLGCWVLATGNWQFW